MTTRDPLMLKPLKKSLFLAALILSACYQTPARPDPFAIPRQAFFDSIQTVVVTSVSVVGELRISDSTLSEFETRIEDKLKEAGFSVVPASEYAATWQRISDEAGGFFDPYTGERNEEKFQAAAERLNDELVERFEPDALLYPEIWEVDAPFSQGVAQWAGVAREVVNGRGYSGDIMASTLFVIIQNRAGNELYAQEAGIQLLEYMLRGQLTTLSEERLFSDSTWIPTAVSQALDPLVTGRSQVPP